jgi:hypothetical protein
LNLSDSKPTDVDSRPRLVEESSLYLSARRPDVGLAHVAGLANLQYLNLYGTGITD